jgi:hypothetical protein
MRGIHLRVGLRTTSKRGEEKRVLRGEKNEKDYDEKMLYTLMRRGIGQKEG